MLRLLLFLASAAALFAADDAWDKVKALKSGTEVRILRPGNPTPLEGKLDEVRDDDLVLVIKNEQKAIRKDQILRLDARPKPGSRMTTETRTKTDTSDSTPPVGMDHGANVPGQSTSTNVTFGSKPGYETVYRRPLGHAPPTPPPAGKK